MKSNQKTKSLFIYVLSLAILFSGFPNLMGKASANPATTTASRSTAELAKSSPSPSPSALPVSSLGALEPEPTTMPMLSPSVTSAPDSLEPSNAIEPQASIASQRSMQATEIKASEGYDILNDPELRAIFQKYLEHYGDQEVQFDPKFIQPLVDEGASAQDIYIIALLYQMYAQDPGELWKQKQSVQESWIELEQKLEKNRQALVPGNVTADVYVQREGRIRVEKQTVKAVVYEENPLISSEQFRIESKVLSALSRSINDALSQLGLKDKYQTFNQQFSNQNHSTESIDPITGMLTWRNTQISLPGKDGMDLNLGVIFQSNAMSQFYPAITYDYDEGRRVNTGALDNTQFHNYLGLGWTFNVPTIKNPGYYSDGQGSQYEIMYVSPQDGSTPYYTLKDYPTGGVKIEYGMNGSTTIHFPDNSEQYFTSDLTILYDRFGNAISYNYNSEGNISYIKDTIGRRIQFEYQAKIDAKTPNIIVKVLDDNQAVVKEVKYFEQGLGYNGARGLRRIEQTANESIQFEFYQYTQEFDYMSKTIPNRQSLEISEYMLKRVQYNESSETVYNYEYGLHNLSVDGVIQKSRVSGRSDRILRKSQSPYEVNRQSIHYSGDYSAYGTGSDPENVPAGYQFSTAVSSLDTQGNVQKITTTTFNHLKQRISEESKIVAGNQAGQRVVTSYANFSDTYKFKPAVIEERTYEGEGDSNPNVMYTDLTYDAMGYVLTQTLPLPPEKRNDNSIKLKYTRSYQYDPVFHFVSSTNGYANESDAAPLSETTTYTSEGRIEQSVNAKGEITKYFYAKDNSAFTVTAERWSEGRLVSKVMTVYGEANYKYAYPTETKQWFNIGQPNEQIIQSQMSYYKDSGLLKSETNSANQTTEYFYDELGRVVTVNKPNFRNASGELFSEKDEYTYKYNQVSTHFDEVNADTNSFVVDTFHTLKKVVDGSTLTDHRIQFYNGLGQTLLDERYDPSAERFTQTQYHYDEWMRPVYVKDAAGNTLSMRYDGWGRQNKVTNADGNQVVSDYSPKARRSTSYIQDITTTEKFNYAETSFDAWGNQISASTYKDWPNQQQKITETYRYNLMGKVTGYTDPNHNLNEDGVTTSFTYDALGRLTNLKDALNQTTNYSYDGNGQVTKVTIQAKGGTPQTLNTKSYNELGLPSIKQDGASQSESYTYNNLGQLAAKTDRNGSSFGYVYDESGQLKTSTIRGNINNVVQTQETKMIFGDGSLDKQTVLTSMNGVQTASHTQIQNSLGQVRSVYSESGAHTAWMGNELDVLGRMKRITDNYMGFSANYQYQKERLDKVQTNGSSTLNSDPSVNAQYSYYANNQIQRIVYPTLTDGSQLITTYTYNKALGWTESMRNTKGSGSLSSYNYSYDNNGNRISVSESRNGAAAQTTNYAYDALNRLISTTRPDGGQTTYTYDVRGNRLTLSDMSTVSLDSADTSYTYDLQNTLTSVTKGGTNIIFKYYADGMRSMKIKDNIQTQVNYNFQGQVISEEKLVNGGFVEQANFVRGDRVLVKKDKKAAKDYYYLYNGHGDVVQIVDTNGTVVNNYAYDEWGNITSQLEGTSNSFKYTGEMYDDETGLYYLRARYYDPSMGRFLNEDTYEGQIDNPLSQNLYTYVHNNPLIYNDPTGHVSSKIRSYWFAVKHPKIAKAIGEVTTGKRSTNISTVAVRFATNDLGLKENAEHAGSQVNAYRHAFWQAMISAEYGKSIAEEVGNAHEEKPDANLNRTTFDKLLDADQSIDLLNNIAGRAIGSTFSKGASRKDIALATLEYYHVSGLYVAVPQTFGTTIVYSITLQKLSDQEYEVAKKRITKLDNDGFAADQ